jgi:hypothetical protein
MDDQSVTPVFHGGKKPLPQTLQSALPLPPEKAYNTLMPLKKNPKTMPQAPQGRWLYDFIMRGIEPELLHSEEELEVRNKGETAISHAARMERYEQAFKEFDRVLSLITGSLMEETQKEKSLRRRASGVEEARQKTAESSAAESSLHAFSPDV